ncbi:MULTISPECIES: PTS galactosamine/N-acetylgalactosamine transporter subunit IIA [Heyndrickxia]|uniref:PTS galactosamine/N-acetylgalactosamine transporter subunit IIA n=1 Tax=Heyndrickxia TaxID=2837504 RepID=UPI002DBB85E5|nr:PTS galactosamine/N-acetylgalactosamine transporter subunit IIA [Weizmannia sp. CD-2023]MEC2224611.1 PTS galactosamine/N-acetylgalactosamine transporter subunit IIA [Weizmannia sp. CD-2023]
MIGMIVTGHGEFATGITSALELVLGKQESYVCVNFPNGDTAVELEKNLDRAVSQLEECDHIIVFADLLSGSPFNTAIMKAMKDKRIKVIYGVNFGMLIEAVMNRNMGTSVDEIVQNALANGKNQIGVFKTEAASNIDDDAL